MPGSPTTILPMRLTLVRFGKESVSGSTSGGRIAEGTDQPQRIPGLATRTIGDAYAGAADRSQSQHARGAGRQSDGVAADQRQAIAFASRLDSRQELSLPFPGTGDAQRQQC